MLYRFKTPADADLIMMRVHGDALLGIIGKTTTPRGIVAVAELPAALRALDTTLYGDDTSAMDDEHDMVSLRRRAWPLMEMFKRAIAAQVPVIWGA